MGLRSRLRGRGPREVREGERAVVVQDKTGVVGHLPQVPVRIGEVAGVPAVRRPLRCPGNRGSGTLRRGHDLIRLTRCSMVPIVTRSRHPL
jgi:hypothetical protein